jgi:hypothetical protein
MRTMIIFKCHRATNTQDAMGTMNSLGLVGAVCYKLLRQERKIGGRVISRSKGIDWVQQAQDRIQWQFLVNTVIYLRVSYKRGISSPVDQLSSLQETLCTIMLLNTTNILS